MDVGESVLALERRVDVQRVAASLRVRDRELAELLMDRGPSEAARAMGLSRSSVYAAINRIRNVFTQAGLGPAMSLRDDRLDSELNVGLKGRRAA